MTNNQQSHCISKNLKSVVNWGGGGGGCCCYKIRMLQSYRAQKSMAVGHRRWNRPNSNLYHLIDLINNFVILVDSSKALLSPQFVVTTGM